ncbi:MAG: hypothetical protein SPE53_01175 [Prevotella sp.]|nr:hypothetical protein [Paraprevotella sp.]MCI6202074.1 hypothetical protein [Paraprevotella sp.]MDY4407732.1 hypothetical protein [Prevotella sp.]
MLAIVAKKYVKAKYEYKKVVEGARSGDLRCKRLKREYEELPEFKEYGITPIEL